MSSAASQQRQNRLRWLAGIGLVLLAVGAALLEVSRLDRAKSFAPSLAAVAPWIGGLGLLLLLFVFVVLLFGSDPRLAWPELWVGLLLFAAVLLPNLPSSGPAPTTSLHQLRVKVSELDSGASRLHRGRLATLVVLEETGAAAAKTVKATRYYDLKILDLLSASAIPVTLSEAAPDSILLDVPAASYDALYNAWRNKKGAYLVPQAGAITPTPTPTGSPVPTPMPTPTAGVVAFGLPVANITIECEKIQPNRAITIFLIVDRTDSDGNVVVEQPVPYAAQLVELPSLATATPQADATAEAGETATPEAEATAESREPSCAADGSVSVTLSRAGGDAAIATFARDLPLADSILVLPRYPLPTQTP